MSCHTLTWKCIKFTFYHMNNKPFCFQSLLSKVNVNTNQMILLKNWTYLFDSIAFTSISPCNFGWYRRGYGISQSGMICLTLHTPSNRSMGICGTAYIVTILSQRFLGRIIFSLLGHFWGQGFKYCSIWGGHNELSIVKYSLSYQFFSKVLTFEAPLSNWNVADLFGGGCSQNRTQVHREHARACCDALRWRRAAVQGGATP